MGPHGIRNSNQILHGDPTTLWEKCSTTPRALANFEKKIIANDDARSVCGS